LAPLIATAEETNVRHVADLYEADQRDTRNAYYLPASEEYLARDEALDREYLERIKKLDFASLDARDRVEYLLLATTIRQSLTNTARDRDELAKTADWLDFRTTIHALERARRQRTPLDSQTAASQVAELTDRVKKLQELLDDKKKKSEPSAAEKGDSAATETEDGAHDDEKVVMSELTPALALSVATNVDRLQQSLRAWKEYYHGTNPGFGWWFDKPWDQANKQLGDYADALRTKATGSSPRKDKSTIVGKPLGREALAQQLELEWIAYSADELIAIAEREKAWCIERLREAAGEMDLNDWQEALRRVKKEHAPPGKQDELVASIVREATDFVRQRDLLDVSELCEKSWGISMLSPDQIRTIPYAAYSGPNVVLAYADERMSHDEKLSVMNANNRHFMRIVIPHEVIPGHHLEAFYRSRLTHSPRMGTPFFTEGWALYWEMRLWDLDWATTPEDRIGVLFWRLHRAARVIVSLKFHQGQMTPDEMIRFLVEEIGHERYAATSEVRRFMNYPPLYQAGYLIGGLQLRSLQRELVGSKRMTDKEFHQAVLTTGSMPIELLRLQLLELPSKRDARPGWRFDDGERDPDDD
jgi:hypothetical protein